PATRDRGRDERALSRRVASHHRTTTLGDHRIVNFAREGLIFIVIAALIAAGAYALALNRRSWPLWLLAFVLPLVAPWVAYFFRDPERLGARGRQLVIAPADGKIVQIAEVDEPAFLQSR